MHKSLSGQTPQYLADDVQLVADSGRRRLRSTSDRTCVVPRTHNIFGDRSFSAAGPRVWNALPPELRHDISFGSHDKNYNFAVIEVNQISFDTETSAMLNKFPSVSEK